MGSIFRAINRKDFDVSIFQLLHCKIPICTQRMGVCDLGFAVGASGEPLPVATGFITPMGLFFRGPITP